MLNSPPPVSDNFLNEAHYVLIDFSYSFSPVNTPKVLLLHSALPAPRSAPPASLLFPLRLSPPPPARLPARPPTVYLRYLSVYPLVFFFFFFFFISPLPEQRQNSRTLKGAERFPISKTNTSAHSHPVT